MQILRGRGLAAAPAARGSVVVIDVLRAFTTAAFALARGARAIRLVGDPEQAFALRAADPARVLVGEEQGRQLAGFDHGNSPERIDGLDLAGREVVLRTSSGTRGVARATGARRVWLGSLVVGRATARELVRAGDDVCLLAMGWAGNGEGPEDDACGDYLEALLRGQEPDAGEVVRRVRASPAARNALDPAQPWITPGDLERALELDRFDFAMPVERDALSLFTRGPARRA